MSLRDVIAANERALDRFSDPELRRLLPILEELRDETANKLAKLLSGDLSTPYTMTQHQQFLTQLNASIKHVEKKVPWAAQMDVRTGVIELAPSAVRNVKAMMDAGSLRYHGTVTGLRLDVARIVGSSSESLMARHAASAMRYSGRVGQRVRLQMMIGVIRGETLGQIARRMVGRRADDQSPSANASAITDKAHRSNLKDAEQLVRTELNHAYNVIQEDSIAEANRDDPGWKKQWDATLDRRTCPSCRAVHGQIRALHENFSCGVPRPPLHPRDRCGIIPVRDDWGVHEHLGDAQRRGRGRHRETALPGLTEAARRLKKFAPPVIEFSTSEDPKESLRIDRKIARLAKKLDQEK